MEIASKEFYYIVKKKKLGDVVVVVVLVCFLLFALFYRVEKEGARMQIVGARPLSNQEEMEPIVKVEFK